MSENALLIPGTWTAVPHRVLSVLPKMGEADVKVFVAVALAAFWGNGGVAELSEVEIAFRCGLSDRGVRKALGTLRGLGLLKRVPSRGRRACRFGYQVLAHPADVTGTGVPVGDGEAERRFRSDAHGDGNGGAGPTGTGVPTNRNRGSNEPEPGFRTYTEGQKTQTDRAGWVGRCAEGTEERATPERLIAELELLGIPSDERGALAAGLAMIRNPLRVIHAAAEKGARNGQLLGCLKALVQPIAPTPAAVPQGKNPPPAWEWMPAAIAKAAADDPGGFEAAVEQVVNAEYRGKEQSAAARNIARQIRQLGPAEAIAQSAVLRKRLVDRLGLKAPEPVVSQEKVGLKAGRGFALEAAAALPGSSL